MCSLLRNSSECLENDQSSAELDSVQVRGATQVPVAAELMWVADASVVYWRCLLAKAKFSNVQGVLLSAVFTLPAVLHPSVSQSWRGS